MHNSESEFPRGDRPALDELAHTDLLLDALAARTETEFRGRNEFLEDRALAQLLGEWRDDLRWPPASALVSQDEAEEALRDGMMQRHGGRRGLAAVGSVAATLLALSGFGAVVADAKPGDMLYGLHAMIFNEPRVSDDQIVLSAKADLAKVEQMIAQGQWDQAQNQLAEVSSTLRAVNDGSRRQGLLAEVNQLNTRVEQRDPTASRPAAPPANSLTPITQTTQASGSAQLTTPVAPTPTTAPPTTTTTPTPSPTPTTTVPKTSATTAPSPTEGPTPSSTESPPPSSKTRHRHRQSVTPSEAPGSPMTAP